ncbi:CoA transferase [Ramlibacter sp. H39-3-26]|uniref:CoA transferase n=1 Tax=Curvibacter soli TaxID=3031331 RepID=UPI0023DB4B7F|nr:CoA transferase [Ramlibacter sp. H39-3-26]MDF1483809.1 CoA transferase [Ramlibacter sp. H39-3-26]
MHDTPLHHYLRAIWSAAGGPASDLAHTAFTGDGALPSVFAVSDFAAAAMAGAGLALASLVAARGGQRPAVRVDRRLASFWFATSLRPQGWSLPPAWDPVAGDYAARDGWIRLHTNAAHHRAAALAVLGAPADKDALAQAVAGWNMDELETTVLARGGCAGAMRPQADWALHPQGQAVAVEPLLHSAATGSGPALAWAPTPERPLAGIRVLDATRILAGPVATRCLAGFGAQVLRIDPPGWEEPGLAPEVTLGKRCARLDLKDAAGRAAFERLLGEADVFVHGLRPDALERLGLGAAQRQRICRGLVDVCLDAYGWSGPWQGRRGFDSIVQMSTGIAEAGMRLGRRDRPTPLPVQALDQAAGYLLAMAAVRGLQRRLETGQGSQWRASLARTAALLASMPPGAEGLANALRPEEADDLAPGLEATPWGPARRLLPPLALDGAAMRWDLPATALGSAAPRWADA